MREMECCSSSCLGTRQGSHRNLGTLLATIALVTCFLNATDSCPAQDSSKDKPRTRKSIATRAASTTPATDDGSPSKKTTPRGRLPNHFAKLGVSEEQREEIYTIQARMRKQISALEKQILELQSEENRQIEDLLTDRQRTLLQSLRSAARERKTKEKKSVTRD